MKNKQHMITELTKGRQAILNRTLTGAFTRTARKGVDRKPMVQQKSSRRLSLS